MMTPPLLRVLRLLDRAQRVGVRVMVEGDEVAVSYQQAYSPLADRILDYADEVAEILRWDPATAERWVRDLASRLDRGRPPGFPPEIEESPAWALSEARIEAALLTQDSAALARAVCRHERYAMQVFRTWERWGLTTSRGGA
jgi:hypothetical protein